MTIETDQKRGDISLDQAAVGVRRGEESKEVTGQSCVGATGANPRAGEEWGTELRVQMVGEQSSKSLIFKFWVLHNV